MAEGMGIFGEAAQAAAGMGIRISAEELAALASDRGMGEGEIAAVRTVFSYLAEQRRQKTVDTLLRLSRLPSREPKTFEGFDFSRIQHLAQAYGRACCMKGLRTYYLKASELRDRLSRAAERGSVQRGVAALVKPSCLIVDEIGRCRFDRACTDMFFDIVDRRYEKDGPSTVVLTSNMSPSDWKGSFTGEDALLCALDRLFDNASVFMMRGPSYRGRGLDTYSVEAVPQAMRQRGSGTMGL